MGFFLWYTLSVPLHIRVKKEGIPMGKTIILYKSSTGFTKWYAEQIAAALSCPLLPLKEATAERLFGCDTVIFGSRAHAGRIDSFDKAKALVKKSGAKNLILFVTGATPNDAEAVVKKFWENNLTAEELSSLPHFYMQGGLNYERMSLPDKLMMKAAAAMVKKKKDKTPEDLAFQQAIAHSFDHKSTEYIAPLLAYLRGEGKYAG